LFAQKIPPRQRRVLRAGLGGIVALPVMALGENGNTIDVRLLERAGELPRIKLAANVGNKWRGMKVEMNLALVPAKGVFNVHVILRIRKCFVVA